MKEHIYKLEHSLIAPETRNSVAHLIANDFIEFSSSGKIHRKDDVLQYLKTTDLYQFSIKDFAINRLAENVILATYMFITDNSTSLRSSVWKQVHGNWQIIFHQGTKVPVAQA